MARNHSTKSSQSWSVADVTFIEVAIAHPSERQMRIDFENGVRLTVGHRDEIPLAVELIDHLRTLANYRREGGAA